MRGSIPLLGNAVFTPTPERRILVPTKSVPGRFSMGADPELIFVNNKGIVSAGDYFDRQNNHAGNNPEIGADGHPWTAEVRPAPGYTPDELVQNLRGIFTRNYKALPDDVSWVAGSFVHGKSIGGHIHFGGIKASMPIIAALDGIVSQTVILMEDQGGARMRRAGMYGQLGDVRTKSWGFEYRPLPSWIVSEQIATAVIALAKAVVFEEVDDGSKGIRKLNSGMVKLLTHINHNDFKKCNKKYFHYKYERIFKHILELSYWKTEEGKNYVRHMKMLNHIISRYEDWQTDKDILDRWKIRKTPSYYKFERVRSAPVIQLEEVLDMNAGWIRLNAP